MPSSEEQPCSIDGAGPFPVVRPASVSDLQDVVRQAAGQGQALFPLGGRTALSIGKPPARAGLGVDLTGLDQVIDYPARDMTITVQAGVTLARLQELLKAEGQRLPIDVAQPERATLGGALATNIAGPRRLGFGTLRDYVIGITTINDEGHQTKAGGRVVKNVAGYDLCKLHIGALGTLGIISQVTLKLRPLPEESALVVCRCEAVQVASLLDLLQASRVRPVCVDLYNARASAALGLAGSGWHLVVGFEEGAEAVRWQVEHLMREVATRAVLGVDAHVGLATEPLWKAMSEFRHRPGSALSFKANLLPHAVVEFCQAAEKLAPELDLQAHVESGIVVGHLGDATLEQAEAFLQTLQRSVGAAQGNWVILHCPPAWKARLAVWGAPRGDAVLMKAVRDKLDPRGLFNPGRFLVG